MIMMTIFNFLPVELWETETRRSEGRVYLPVEAMGKSGSTGDFSLGSQVTGRWPEHRRGIGGSPRRGRVSGALEEERACAQMSFFA